MSEERSNLEKEVAYCLCPKGHRIAWASYNAGKELFDDGFQEAGMICDNRECDRAYGLSKLKLIYKD